jgi:hypothetical protein
VVHSLEVAHSWSDVAPVPHGDAAHELVMVAENVVVEKPTVPQHTWLPHVEADMQLSVVVTEIPPSDVYVVDWASPLLDPLLEPPLDPLLAAPVPPSSSPSPFPEFLVDPPHAARIVATVVAVKAKMVIFFIVYLLPTQVCESGRAEPLGDVSSLSRRSDSALARPVDRASVDC